MNRIINPKMMLILGAFILTNCTLPISPTEYPENKGTPVSQPTSFAIPINIDTPIASPTIIVFSPNINTPTAHPAVNATLTSIDIPIVIPVSSPTPLNTDTPIAPPPVSASASPIAPPPPPAATSPITPSATPTGIEDALSPNNQSNPEGFVRWYFKRVTTERDYVKTWEYMTDRYKQDTSGDLNDYIDWWDSVRSVVVNQISYEGQVNSSQHYLVSLTFYMKNDKVIPGEYNYYLVFNNSLGHWQFDHP